jgi:hypothetical protein
VERRTFTKLLVILKECEKVWQFKNNHYICITNKIKMSEKIFHLHLQDSMRNNQTLICNLVDGSIKYSYFTGWSSSGIPLALSNLQTTLPIENLRGETKEGFTNRVADIINNNSVCRVVKSVNKVEFVAFA